MTLWCAVEASRELPLLSAPQTTVCQRLFLKKQRARLTRYARLINLFVLMCNGRGKQIIFAWQKSGYARAQNSDGMPFRRIGRMASLLLRRRADTFGAILQQYLRISLYLLCSGKRNNSTLPQEIELSFFSRFCFF